MKAPVYKKLVKLHRIGALGWLRWLLVALVALAVIGSKPALADTIVGVPTTIDSDAERMISYRHQEHSWQTSDGAVHLMVNRGTLSAGSSLTLYTSLDQGVTWSSSLSLTSTNAYSSSDGVLVGDELWVAFSSSVSTILFAVLKYDPITTLWSQVKLERVFKSASEQGLNPGIVVDRSGAVWCGFVRRDNATLNNQIVLFRRPPEGGIWSDTGLLFGAADNISVERSARPVLTADGVGMLFSVHEKLSWAFRRDAWSPTQPWTQRALWVRSPEDLDPYASHLSVAKDSLGNLHMALSDQGKLRYFRLPAGTQQWTTKLLTTNIKATYPQLTVNSDEDAVMIMVDNQVRNIKVLQSLDSGTTFVSTDLLTHVMGDTLSYENARVEAPSLVSGPVTVVQQYVDGALQKLMQFNVMPLSASTP